MAGGQEKATHAVGVSALRVTVQGGPQGRDGAPHPVREGFPSGEPALTPDFLSRGRGGEAGGVGRRTQQRGRLRHLFCSFA